jgi:hypothetical protein
MKFIYVFVIILSIYKSFDWIEKIQFFFSNWFIFLRGKIYIYVHYWKEFKFKLEYFHLDKIIIRHQGSKMMFCEMFEIR